MAYRAEIEIAVKGARELSQFQNKLKATALEVEQLNNFLKNFADQAAGVPRSLSSLNRQLQEASEAFNDVALGTQEAKTAASDYLAATRNLNAGLRERAALLAEVAENERKARLASRGIQERTQYSGPIGPQESLILKGQSSPIDVSRLVAAKKDQLELDRALFDLARKTAEPLNIQLQLQEGLVAGAREALELAEQARRKQQFLAGGPAGGPQGPLVPAGKTGFAVALPLLKIEEASLKLARRKQQILDRTAQTRRDLNGLAQSLQRLDTDSVVAIKDANREQQKLNDQKEEAIRLTQRQLEISKQGALLAGRFSPVGGAENIPGSPAFLAARRRRRKDAIGSAIIGGAFPLLFGQGVGASLGGGLGGAGGGLIGGQFGFGLSLVGTAVGQSFDNLIGSAADLGKALNPVNTDIDRITEALGIAGTKTAAYIEALKETGQSTEAAAFAVRKLEEIVGSDGVAAFEQFGRESQQLTNELAKFFTQLQSSLAQLVNELGVIKAAAEGVGRAVDIGSAREARGRSSSLDAALDELDKERSSPASGLAGMGIGALVPAEATEAEKKVLEEYNKLLMETGEILDANAIKAREKAKELESELVIAEQKLTLERGNNDVLNASVEAALRAIAAEETRLELIAAQGDARKIELALLNAAAKKLKIDNAIVAARARASRVGRGGGGVAPKSKELSLQRDLVKEELKRADIALKYVKIAQGEEAALLLSNQYLAERQEKLIQILELERQEALAANKVAGDVVLINQLYDSRLQTLRDQVGLQAAENAERLKATQLEENLLRISLERENAALSRGIGRDIESAKARLANPFGGEALQQLELQIEQTRRYDDAIRSTSEALEEVNKKLKDRPNDNKLQLEQTSLEKRLALYKELLPILDQVEQKELRQQQIIQKYGFIVDSVASGLSDVIVGAVKGTETVEQAFSRMFENIGRAFIDMATKMLAQQLFLTVLSALGNGGGGGGGRVGPGLFNLSGGQFGAFAEGGFVTGPTRAIVGEGNQPEYIIPQNKMKESMARYSRGARGSAVIPQNGDTAPNSTSGAATAAQPIDVRYTVERINSVDYVTADQFQQGMRQAAQQGAKQGEQQTLRRLQMSSSTRRRLGV